MLWIWIGFDKTQGTSSRWHDIPKIIKQLGFWVSSPSRLWHLNCKSDLLSEKKTLVSFSSLLNNWFKAAFIPVACAPFSQHSLPSSLSMNMFWCGTLWTARPFSSDLLGLTLLMVCVFWTSVQSAVLHIIVITALLRTAWTEHLKFSFSDKKYRTVLEVELIISIITSYNHQD